MVTTTTNFAFNLPAVNSVTDEDLWGGYLNTNFTNLDTYMTTPREVLYDLGTTGGALAINLTNGSTQKMVANANITSVTISNPASGNKVTAFSLRITQDGTGGRTITLSSAYDTQNAGGVTLSTAAGAVDILRFETWDNGTTWYVFQNANMS